MTKIEYLNKMTSSLDSNISAYNDYDVIEMEQDMLSALKEVESDIASRSTSVVKFLPGEINEKAIENMIGRIEETAMTSVDDTLIIEEIKSFKEFVGGICTINPISSTQAWISDIYGCAIKLLSLQNKETRSITLPLYFDFVGGGVSPRV